MEPKLEKVNNSSVNEATEDFLRSLKATAGARFNASKRLSHVDKRLTALTAFSSAMVIAMTVWPVFLEVSPNAEPLIQLVTVAFSVLLLVSSLLHYASNHGVKAEIFHMSALEIQELRREVRFQKEGLTEERFKELSQKYNESLQKYSINHDDVDFYRFQMEYIDDFNFDKISTFYRRILVFLSINYPMIFLMLSIIGILAFVWAVYTMPYFKTATI